MTARILQGERGLPVETINLVLPYGNQRTIGETKQTEQYQQDSTVMETHGCLGKAEDRDSRREQQSDAELLGHSQGMAPMNELM